MIITVTVATAAERLVVTKILQMCIRDRAWKSFYALKRSGGIETPRPPRFKPESIPITYMQMGIVHERDADRVRLSLPRALKKYMEETYQIHALSSSLQTSWAVWDGSCLYLSLIHILAFSFSFCIASELPRILLKPLSSSLLSS